MLDLAKNQSLRVLIVASMPVLGAGFVNGAVIVQNNSFETVTPGTTDGNGYANQGLNADTANADWITPTNGGNNTISQPFANGHPIPDGSHVAFVQGSGSISQVIGGLDPTKQYTVTYFVNERGYNNGTAPISSTSASLNNNSTSSAVQNITTTDQYRRIVSGPLSVSGASSTLALNAIGVQGDNSLLLDNVSITRAVPAIANNGFESNVLGNGHFVEGAAPAGWTSTGGAGQISDGSAYGGPNVLEGSQAALLKGNANLSQSISGFEPGVTYSLSYDLVARQNNGLQLSTFDVYLDGVLIASPEAIDSSVLTQWTDTTTNNFSVTTGGPHTLEFVNVTNANNAGGDNSVFLDDVHFNFVAEAPEPASIATLAISAVGLLARRCRD